MDWVSISGLVIALCAFFATMYQAFLSRKHNRLSVRPHLNLDADLKNEPIGTVYSFRVTNCGIGPALIVDRYFTVDGVRFPFDGHGADEVSALVSQVLARKYSYQLLEHGLPAINSALAPGETFNIARISVPILNSLMRDAVEAEIDRIDVVISYRSMYDERFELTTA